MIELDPLSLSDLVLVAVWFFVSLWNTSVGPTGGITFATMASILPPSAVIPIQALVEATSSLYRLWLLRLHVDWRFLVLFVIGGSLGFALGIGARFVAEPSDDLLRVIMGCFILAATWLPIGKVIAHQQSFPWLVGLSTSFVSLFVGGVAALIAAAIDQKHEDHRRVVATMTGSLIYQHGVKVVLFGLFGFAFAAYAHLMVAMLIAAVAGTWIGKHLLFTLPQTIIKPVFKMLVSLLAIGLLWQGLVG